MQSTDIRLQVDCSDLSRSPNKGQQGDMPYCQFTSKGKVAFQFNRVLYNILENKSIISVNSWPVDLYDN